jgi:hypothetical protein
MLQTKSTLIASEKDWAVRAPVFLKNKLWESEVTYAELASRLSYWQFRSRKIGLRIGLWRCRHG